MEIKACEVNLTHTVIVDGRAYPVLSVSRDDTEDEPAVLIEYVDRVFARYEWESFVPVEVSEDRIGRGVGAVGHHEAER